MANWAEKFERVFDRYRMPDGSKWSGAALERATGGKVSRYYISKVRRGRVQEPSFDRIVYISRAMGVPLEEWLEEEEEDR